MSGASDGSFQDNVGPDGAPVFGGWNGGTGMRKNSRSYRKQIVEPQRLCFLEKLDWRKKLFRDCETISPK